jgi:hypothetical protein
VEDYMLDVQGFIPSRDKPVSPLHSMHTGSEIHPLPIGCCDAYTGVKRKELEADDRPPSSVVVKNCGAIPLLSIRPPQHIMLQYLSDCLTEPFDVTCTGARRSGRLVNTLKMTRACTVMSLQ